MARKPDYDVFLNKFCPEMDSTGESIRYYNWDGEDLDILNATAPEYIWTIVSGDNGNLYVSPGRRFVNRMDYVICKHPWKEGQRDYKI